MSKPTTTGDRWAEVESARRKLLARRDELLARHARIATEEQELLGTPEADWEDVAALRSAASVLDRLGEVELQELGRILGALTRMDLGRWGRCERCGGPIAESRLEALPETDRCEHCTNSH